MKLLHVIGSMNAKTGGPCQMIRNFAPAFVAQGNSLDVVCLDPPDAKESPASSFRIHALGEGRGAWNYHPALLPWLKKHLSDYDAVVLNGLWQFPGYALWKASQSPGAPPYFIFPHGMLDPWFQKLSIRPMKAVRNWVYWKAIQHRIVNQSAGLLFTCAEEQRLAREPFRPYRPKKEAVVGLGVPEPPDFENSMTAAFEEKCPGITGRRYFLFMGRIHPKKGVDLLINAYGDVCRSAAATGGLIPPRLVIAGPGWDGEYGQEMRKLAAQVCPPQSVYWPGLLSGDAKWGALYGCEAFVLISHQENFGIAVVEALACGKPVLISSQINIWREIEEDRAGLVREDSPTGAGELFRQWQSLSPEDLIILQKAAQACYRNRFGILPANQRFLAVVNGVDGEFSQKKSTR